MTDSITNQVYNGTETGLIRFRERFHAMTAAGRFDRLGRVGLNSNPDNTRQHLCPVGRLVKYGCSLELSLESPLR